MNRRALLAALAAGAGTAGCLGAPAARRSGDDDRPDDGDGSGGGARPTSRGDAATTDDATGREPAPVARHGLPQDICREPRHVDPGIYAVLDPAFDRDWSGYSFPDFYGALTDDTVVVGIDRGSDARAYPIPVLWHHEVVNDDLGGPLVVTYCPLCKSGLVADRRVAGRPTQFLVSGLLWTPPGLQVEVERDRGSVFGADRSDPDAVARRSGNLVMYDRRTGSYWSQLIARAICGPQAGTELGVVPSTVTTWGQWRRSRDASVLLPPPHSGVHSPRA